MSRVRLIVDAIYPTVILWLVLIAFALWRDAVWPQTNDGWVEFALIIFLIEFFMLKALLMLRRMQGFVILTTSLIATNCSLAVIFLVQLGLGMWPEFFFVRYPTFTIWLSRTLEVMLLMVLLWGLWELANVPPPAPLDEDAP